MHITFVVSLSLSSALMNLLSFFIPFPFSFPVDSALSRLFFPPNFSLFPYSSFTPFSLSSRMTIIIGGIPFLLLRVMQISSCACKTDDVTFRRASFRISSFHGQRGRRNNARQLAECPKRRRSTPIPCTIGSLLRDEPRAIYNTYRNERERTPRDAFLLRGFRGHETACTRISHSFSLVSVPCTSGAPPPPSRRAPSVLPRAQLLHQPCSASRSFSLSSTFLLLAGRAAISRHGFSMSQVYP